MPEGNFCSPLLFFPGCQQSLGALPLSHRMIAIFTSFDLLSPFYEDLDDNKIMFLGQRQQGDLFSSKLPLLHRIITLGSGKTSYSEFQTSLG